MNKEKLLLLKDYINSNISPLLLEESFLSIFDKKIIIESNCSLDNLNGHYEGIEFTPPLWYKELMDISQNSNNVFLVINKINSISLEEQKKFIEILKYKKISTFDLPNNCIIIVTYNNLEKNKIEEEVYSLLIHI